jgi:hypothetical protein
MKKFIVNSAILSAYMDPVACSMGLPKMLQKIGVQDVKVVTCYCCGEAGKVVAHFEAPSKEYLSKALGVIKFPVESIMEANVILPKEVPREKAFYFYTEMGGYIGQNSASLEDFLEKVNSIDVKSLEFHFYRGDFEKWFKEVLGYKDLDEEIRNLRKLNLKGQMLRTRLYDTVSKFLEMQER